LVVVLVHGGPGERKVELTYEELEARREIKRKRDREYRSKRREMQHSQPSCTLCGAVGVPLHQASTFSTEQISALSSASGQPVASSAHICNAHFAEQPVGGRGI
jgi:hypothetical protein